MNLRLVLVGMMIDDKFLDETDDEQEENPLFPGVSNANQVPVAASQGTKIAAGQKIEYGEEVKIPDSERVGDSDQTARSRSEGEPEPRRFSMCLCRENSIANIFVLNSVFKIFVTMQSKIWKTRQGC